MGTGLSNPGGIVTFMGVLLCASGVALADPASDAIERAKAPAPAEAPVSGNPTKPVTLDAASEPATDEAETAPAPEPRPRKKLLLPDPPAKPVEPVASEPAGVTLEPIPAAPQESLPLGGSPASSAEFGSAAPLTRDSNTTTVGSGGWALQTLSALAIVIALIFGLRVVLQRMTGQSPVGPASRVVEVLARTTIAPKTSVILIKVGGSVLAVGHTPSGLNTLAEFDDPGDVASLLSQVSASKPLSITESFRSVLTGADAGYDDSDGPDEAAADRTHEQVNGLLARMRSFGKRDSA